MKVFKSLGHTINISTKTGNIHLNYLEVHELIVFLRKEYPEQFSIYERRVKR